MTLPSGQYVTVGTQFDRFHALVAVTTFVQEFVDVLRVLLPVNPGSQLADSVPVTFVQVTHALVSVVVVAEHDAPEYVVLMMVVPDCGAGQVPCVITSSLHTQAEVSVVVDAVHEEPE